MAAMAAVSLGAPLSAALDYSNRASSVLSAVDDAGSALARACLVLGPVLVVGVLALQFGRTEGWSIRGFAARRRRITCLLFAIAVATPTQSVFDAIPWPGWIITLIAVLWLTRRMEPAASPMDRGALLDAASVDFALRSDLEKLDATPPTTEAEAAERRSKRHDVIEKTRPDVARQFLACGPRANWASNARFGAVLGLWVGALPIAFFAFTAVRTLGRPSGNYLASDLLLVVLAVLLNTVFWAVAGFAVTGLYSSLPGRTGPTKAVALWGIWLASAIAAELVAAFPWAPDPTEWVYVALELLLGLVGISVAHDLASVRAVDGNWRRLLEVYNVHRLRDLSRYLIPLVLAVVGLVQQIASGSAADIVQAALDGISSALNPAVR
jgi:hypothetical protein